MTQIDYLYYQIATGWSNIRRTFKNWVDLMGGDYKHYALLKEDDPLTECLEWFWYDLNGEELYSKEFLEYLYQLSEEVRTGKVDIYKFKSFNELVDDLKDCE